MATPAKLPKSWPSTARDILLDAARYYYREMKEPWPVPRGGSTAGRHPTADRCPEEEPEAARRRDLPRAPAEVR